MTEIHDNKPIAVFQMLNSLWALIATISGENRGFKLIECRIEQIVEMYHDKYSKIDSIINEFITLLQNLDASLTTLETIPYRSTINRAIESVLTILREFGAVEITANEQQMFDPYIHCAIGTIFNPELPRGTIIEVARRGFVVDQHVYPAQVIASTDRKAPETEETETKEQPFAFGKRGQKKVVAAFDGGDITSDSGSLLLAGVDQAIGLTQALSEAIVDQRDQRYVQHQKQSLFAQRIYQIVLGYEDGNDCNFLRKDPAFLAAIEREKEDEALASQPTMSRFENSISKTELMRIAYTLGKIFIDSYTEEPEIIVLDFDTTDDATYGDQQMTLFNAFYDEYCYLPLHVYEGLSGKLITTILRPGKNFKGTEIVAIAKRVIKFIRQYWQNTTILFRADSAFSRVQLLDWLEEQDILYAIGYSKNQVLLRLSQSLRTQAKNLFNCWNTTVKRYGSVEYQAGSWDKPRRVIVKAEISEKGENPRFVISNIDSPEKVIYEQIYCLRGQAENFIKDHKNYLKSDRTSCSSFQANQFRLFLHSAAYILMHTLKTQYLKDSAFEHATFNTIQIRILKVGARVRSGKTRIRFYLPSSYPLKILWRKIVNILFPCPSTYPLRC